MNFDKAKMELKPFFGSGDVRQHEVKTKEKSVQKINNNKPIRKRYNRLKKKRAGI